MVTGAGPAPAGLHRRAAVVTEVLVSYNASRDCATCLERNRLPRHCRRTIVPEVEIPNQWCTLARVVGGALAVHGDGVTGPAHFDFGGTSSEVLGNTNAPPAVAPSAVIYALRCLVGRDIPLNEGCLAPVCISIPPGSLLNPSPAAGVVGGNVLTSQRVTDVVFQAFQAAAASQGCMNNLTLGDDGMEFHETICGGSGAGPSWSGRSGVHTHMTNTRITDPEIIEKRYPIVLRAFFLRQGSGCAGARRGGDGVIRALEFRKPLQCSILSECREFAPWGLTGAARGRAASTCCSRATPPPGAAGRSASCPPAWSWAAAAPAHAVMMHFTVDFRGGTPGGGLLGFSAATEQRPFVCALDLHTICDRDGAIGAYRYLQGCCYGLHETPTSGPYVELEEQCTANAGNAAVLDSFAKTSFALRQDLLSGTSSPGSDIWLGLNTILNSPLSNRQWQYANGAEYPAVDGFVPWADMSTQPHANRFQCAVYVRPAGVVDSHACNINLEAILCEYMPLPAGVLRRALPAAAAAAFGSVAATVAYHSS